MVASPTETWNVCFETVRDDGSGIASEPRDDGRERSGSRVEKNTIIRHKTIKKVTEDIHRYNFNTAVAALMEYVNELYKNGASKEDLVVLAKLLKPFAPHLASEMLEKLDSDDEWPKWDEKYLVADTVELVEKARKTSLNYLNTIQEGNTIDNNGRYISTATDYKSAKVYAGGLNFNLLFQRLFFLLILINFN